MDAAEELISLYEKKLALSAAREEDLRQKYNDLKVCASALTTPHT